MVSSAKSVHVELGDRSYEVWIETGLLDRFAATLAEATCFSRAIIITDSQVGPIYSERCTAQLSTIAPTSVLEIPAGESSKCVQQAEQLWEQALYAGAGRDTLIVGLGGGVVGDLAGFVAATFARGLPFAQIPTSLLAQVDSSVGGKVGINLSTAKNMVGAFWQPQAVFIDLEVLSTLAIREYRAGLAEVFKYGVIYDADFFAQLESSLEAITSQDAERLAAIVARCCEIKAAVVAADERETAGQREILNYGHTFAHAIEALSGYGVVLHGEAVAIGMICASHLAIELGMIDTTVLERQRQLLSAVGLPTALPAFLGGPRMLEVMQTDKKVRDGDIRFVLPTKIGHVEVVSQVDPQAVLRALSKAQAPAP